MELLNHILGLNAQHLTPVHMAARAFVAFFICLAYIRLAGLRTLGRHSSFDQLTALILGSIMGRSIVSTASFPGALLATLVIMLLHRFVAFVTCRSHKAGNILKGKPLLLWQNGQADQVNMQRENISNADVEEAMRIILTINDLEKVKEIYLERSGEISVVKKETPSAPQPLTPVSE
jgi:uncharacterized membrane protein YcaP (DUF421 family)